MHYNEGYSSTTFHFLFRPTSEMVSSLGESNELRSAMVPS